MLPGRDVPTETNRGAGDPQLWRDPITNRVWYTTIGGSDVVEAAICQVDLSYSDDDGKKWVNNPDPALWGCPAFDFPRPFTGPPRTSTIPPGERYPDVLYLCKSSQTMPDRQRWKSLDSGKSFTEIPASGQYQPWTADINGVVYGVSNGPAPHERRRDGDVAPHAGARGLRWSRRGRPSRQTFTNWMGAVATMALA